MKITNELKVGIFITLTIAGLLWGMNYLKGTDMFTTTNKFFAVYDDVGGLVKSNPVLLNGYKVGQVADVRYADDKSGRLVLTLKIDDDVFIPKSTEANIVTSDILGTKAVELVYGKDKTPAQNKDTLSGFSKKGLSEQILPFKDKAEGLVSSLDTLAHALANLLNAESSRSLNKTFANLEHATGSIDHLVSNDKSKLNSLLSNVDLIAANLKNNNSEIANILKNLSAVSDTLARLKLATTIDNANKALADLNSVLHKIDKGEGSLGKIINDDSLYVNLNAASASLDKLLIDLKANPKRYVHVSVFGKKDK